MKTSKKLLTVLAASFLLFAATVGFIYHAATSCDTEDFQQINSPDGRVNAHSYSVNCGPRARDRILVDIVSNTDSKKETVVVVNGSLDKENLAMEWTATDTLKVITSNSEGPQIIPNSFGIKIDTGAAQ